MVNFMIYKLPRKLFIYTSKLVKIKNMKDISTSKKRNCTFSKHTKDILYSNKDSNIQ